MSGKAPTRRPSGLRPVWRKVSFRAWLILVGMRLRERRSWIVPVFLLTRMYGLYTMHHSYTEIRIPKHEITAKAGWNRGVEEAEPASDKPEDGRAVGVRIELNRCRSV
jgi:hypothetical protein